MNSKLGWPRMVIIACDELHALVLEDSSLPTFPKEQKDYFKNSMFITEEKACFCSPGMKQIRVITPWFLQLLAGFRGTEIEYEHQAKYCKELSGENVYPLLWRAVDVAESLVVVLREKEKLGEFTITPPNGIVVYHSISNSKVAQIPKSLKKRLKKLLEERVPLRAFFDSFRQEITKTSCRQTFD